jgi:predicted dehydrogenase
MSKIWLIGTGLMGIEYSKVLNTLNVDYIAIGRGEHNAHIFEEKIKHKVIIGGLDKFLESSPDIPDAAIVAVNVECLAETAKKLVLYGVKNILLEKPGGCFFCDFVDLIDLSDKNSATVLLAYNRRFYSSVLKAEEIIKADGGIASFHFEFTEWAHVIEKSGKSKGILANWFLANSSHVVDLAFFLGGYPKDMKCFTKRELSWHKPAIFSGAGITDSGALFSYQANWCAPGRWSVEMLTTKHRLYFRPMEALQIQNIGSVSIGAVEINDRLDKEFKPGLYLQTQSFLKKDSSRFCSLKKQYDNIKNIYCKICPEQD